MRVIINALESKEELIQLYRSSTFSRLMIFCGINIQQLLTLEWLFLVYFFNPTTLIKYDVLYRIKYFSQIFQRSLTQNDTAMYMSLQDSSISTNIYQDQYQRKAQSQSQSQIQNQNQNQQQQYIPSIHVTNTCKSTETPIYTIHPILVTENDILHAHTSFEPLTTITTNTKMNTDLSNTKTHTNFYDISK